MKRWIWAAVCTATLLAGCAESTAPTQPVALPDPPPPALEPEPPASVSGSMWRAFKRGAAKGMDEPDAATPEVDVLEAENEATP